MTFEDFKRSISTKDLPHELPVHLHALWMDGKGDWENAHQLIQSVADRDAAWIHAYLHRKEGDTGNADYWYRQAGKKQPAITLQEEWEQIVRTML